MSSQAQQRSKLGAAPCGNPPRLASSLTSASGLRVPGANPGPQERPGAEAHVGTPTGQAQSCPLLLTDRLQRTKKQEAVV